MEPGGGILPRRVPRGVRGNRDPPNRRGIEHLQSRRPYNGVVEELAAGHSDRRFTGGQREIRELSGSNRKRRRRCLRESGHRQRRRTTQRGK